MRHTIFVPFVFLIACAEAPEGATAMADKPITEAADFTALVVGRELALQSDPANTVVINADGSIGGVFGGAALAGTWEWRDGAWCRTLTAGPRGPSPEDCQTWTMTDGAFEVTRDRGAGASFTYVYADA